MVVLACLRDVTGSISYTYVVRLCEIRKHVTGCRPDGRVFAHGG